MSTSGSLWRPGNTFTNLWTDAYLAAFAQLLDLSLVSFDKGFSQRLDFSVLTL